MEFFSKVGFRGFMVSKLIKNVRRDATFYIKLRIYP